jgi:hypothetical protein
LYDPTERKRVVAEVAERAAAEIRRRAEIEAARLREERNRVSGAFLEEQRRVLVELDRAALEHFGVVKADAERLLVTLCRTIEKARAPLPMEIPPPPDPLFEPVPVVAAPSVPAPEVRAQAAPEAAPSAPVAGPDAPVPQPAHEGVPEVAGPAPASQPSAPSASQQAQSPYYNTEATALAAQMATAGSSRDEIVRGLRAAFSISEPEPIADEALSRYGS